MNVIEFNLGEVFNLFGQEVVARVGRHRCKQCQGRDAPMFKRDCEWAMRYCNRAWAALSVQLAFGPGTIKAESTKALLRHVAETAREQAPYSYPIVALFAEYWQQLIDVPEYEAQPESRVLH